MILLFSICNLAWWQVLLSWLLPFLLGWWFSRLLNSQYPVESDETVTESLDLNSQAEMEFYAGRSGPKVKIRG
ncbi:MAG: hypothetical protein IPM86_00180 [Saprospiraceae bacterium]|nr:hypothetical protein [Saprospiraceae bacterium]